MIFRLPDEFVAGYAIRQVPWGFTDGGGNSLGEITFMRTYSRLKEDGTKERWHEVCRRVIEGMYSVQKQHCQENRLPWNENQARHSAQEAYERLFTLKWTPPGRGLWMMGTPLVMEQRNSAALQNCAFISTGDMTKRDPASPFCFLMEALMLGVGVGFDTLGAEKDFTIHVPYVPYETYQIPDTREGWFHSVRLLLESYLLPSRHRVQFDYSLIRPMGAPIRTFGGTASGPGPLIELHKSLESVLDGRNDRRLTTADVVDIANLIGKCVVSGNVRRSAEIAIGLPEDKEFLNLKNYEVNAYRQDWGWMSNNSINATVGMDYTPYLDAIISNGEPGFVWMGTSRKFGRLADEPDNRDYRAKGYNPCGEQTLESYECCTLVETFINRHEDQADWERTLKFAYLYAKTVTLIPTHWPQTNAIMQRNRRIGCSVSGLAAFVDNHGWSSLNKWLNDGYSEVQGWDEIYSEWLGIRESIKTTSIKPSGTVSLLAGETPGVHWPIGGEYILRAVRFSNTDPILDLLRGAGYRVEPAVGNERTTSVAFFPVRGVPVRPEKKVSVFEKVNLAATVQRYWADNSVSATISFDRDREGGLLAGVLAMHEGQLKSISFLPQGNETYPQMPYTELSEDEWKSESRGLTKLDLSWFYDGKESPDAVGEAYCTTDRCEMPVRK